jgi:hypothetical protein
MGGSDGCQSGNVLPRIEQNSSSAIDLDVNKSRQEHQSVEFDRPPRRRGGLGHADPGDPAA